MGLFSVHRTGKERDTDTLVTFTLNNSKVDTELDRKKLKYPFGMASLAEI